jgi:hypothetical protein
MNVNQLENYQSRNTDKWKAVLVKSHFIAKCNKAAYKQLKVSFHSIIKATVIIKHVFINIITHGLTSLNKSKWCLSKETDRDGKPYSSTTSSTTNLIWSQLILNRGLHGDMPVPSIMSYGTALIKILELTFHTKIIFIAAFNAPASTPMVI